MRVLIVEDERRLAQALECILKEQKYQTDVVYNGRDGFDYAMAGAYDVVILDWMLPGMDGPEAARRLREAGRETPILMLTARDALGDKVGGLNSGVDDYMTKPFEPEELLARLNALTRRRGAVVLDELRFEDLCLRLESAELSCGAETVRLNYKEAQLMRLFLRAPEQLFSKDALISAIWGLESEAVDNNVEAYISFLRRKLKFLGSRVGIRNYPKLGYRLEAASC